MDLKCDILIVTLDLDLDLDLIIMTWILAQIADRILSGEEKTVVPALKDLKQFMAV